MNSRSIFLLLIIATIFLNSCKPTTKTTQDQSPRVEVIPVRKSDVPVIREWIGTLDGNDNASIQAQVAGYLLSQDYKDGESVKKGQLLFKIDDRTFQSEVEQEKAMLALAEAKLKKTEMDVTRYTPLAKSDAISKQELDDAIQANAAAKANVDAAKAALQQAIINLGYTQITSPIDGIAGISNAQIGQLVSPSHGSLTVVSNINPIKANFTVSEQEYLEFQKRIQNGSGNNKSNAANVPFQLVLADGSLYSENGHFIALDRQVDERTGSLRMQVSFPNPKLLLRPGQFARVKATIRQEKGALLVPQRAVTELQGSHFVAIIDKNNKASIVKVEVGTRFGSEWTIKSGLNENDTVIVEGIQKIRDGSIVTPIPFQPEKTNTPETIAQAKSESL